MNAKQLHLNDGNPVEAWRCSECGLIYSEKQPYSAERCCTCRNCGASTHDPKRGSRQYVCDKCWVPYHAKKDQESLDRATVVEDYDGPIYDGDRYYESMDDYVDMKDGEELPEFVYACDVIPFSLDADDILTNIKENANLEDDVDLNGVDEFERACKAFNDANKNNVYWDADYKRKVRVPH